MLIQLVIRLLSVSHGGSLLAFLLLLLHLGSLLGHLVFAVLFVDILTLLVELDDQIVLLGIGEPHIIPLHFVYIK